VLGYSQHAYLPVMQISKLTGVLGVSLLIVLFNLFITEVILFFYARKTSKRLSTSASQTSAGQTSVSQTSAGKSGNNRNPSNTRHSGNDLAGTEHSKTSLYESYRKIRMRPFFKNPLFLSGTVIILLIIINTLAGAIYLKINGDKYSGEKLDIVMVQPAVSFDDKFEVDSGVLIPDKTGSSGKYFKDGTDLLIYPESVIWGALEREENKTFYRWIKDTVKNENLYLIMGQILWDENENYYNSVCLYNPALELLGRYNKMHPLPCAEYMPYPDILGFFSFLNVAKLNITPSDKFILIHYPGMGDIGTNICFESTLQIISRTYRKMGADILFTFTDTAGFKNSIAGWHHLIFSRVRAIENNSFMVHSGNNGVSAIVDPYGRILCKADIGTREVLYGSVYFNNNKSFYSKYGELLLYIYCGAVFIALLFYIFKNLAAGKRNRRQRRF
jgi:apolipoprotein N-acyltransferase